MKALFHLSLLMIKIEARNWQILSHVFLLVFNSQQSGKRVTEERLKERKLKKSSSWTLPSVNPLKYIHDYHVEMLFSNVVVVLTLNLN